jgi:F-type H+-transporting ATPase subunit b
MEIITLLAENGGVAAELKAVGENLRTTFGLHGQMLISQIIGFCIFAFCLKKFAFGPIQEMLDLRKARIAEGEENLKRIEKQLADSEATTAAAIAKANEDAKRLIEEAKSGAESFTEQKSQEAIAQAQQIISKANAQAEADRQRISEEIKKEFGRLVAATTTQVTGKVLNDDDRRRINEESLAKVEA